MERFIVFLFLWILLACDKQDCYRCRQSIKVYTNRIVKGYPKNYEVKFNSCGENIEVIDNDFPIVYSDTIGDTIFTFWKNTECSQKRNSL